MIDTLMLEMWARDIARHRRFQRDAHAVLAAIIRSQGGTVRVSRAALCGGGPDDCITRHDDPVTDDVVYRLQALPPKEVAG